MPRYFRVTLDSPDGDRVCVLWRNTDSRSAPCLDAFCIFGLEVPPRHFQVVVGLKVHPELRTVAEVQAQPQRGISGDAPPVVYDLGDTVWWDANRPGDSIPGKPRVGFRQRCSD
jgi:hypothetical protein